MAVVDAHAPKPKKGNGSQFVQQIAHLAKRRKNVRIRSKED